MKLYVHKLPAGGQTLAECREVADNAPAAILPFVDMSLAEFKVWRDAFVWSDAADPAFNPDTHKLVAGPTTFNDTNKTAIRSRVAVPLSQSELDDVDFAKLDNWIATFTANTATNAQVQTAIARILKQLKKQSG